MKIQGVLSARSIIGLLVVVSLLATSCGGTDESADNTSIESADTGGSDDSGAADSTDSTEVSTTTTTVVSTTAVAEATTTELETTVATLASADFEKHLADALLTVDELSPYLVPVVENSHFVDLANFTIGDLTIGPCGEELIEAEAIDARVSSFNWKEGLEVDPQPIILNVNLIVRQVDGSTSSGLVDQFREAASGCAFEEVPLITTGDLALVGDVVEVEERTGVKAVGSPAIVTETGVTVFTFVFETDLLDAHLVLATYGSPTPADDLALVLPVVEATQDRLAACAADTEICSAALG